MFKIKIKKYILMSCKIFALPWFYHKFFVRGRARSGSHSQWCPYKVKIDYFLEPKSQELKAVCRRSVKRLRVYRYCGHPRIFSGCPDNSLVRTVLVRSPLSHRASTGRYIFCFFRHKSRSRASHFTT